MADTAIRLEHAPADDAEVKAMKIQQQDEVKKLEVYLEKLRGYSDFGRFVRLRKIKKRVDGFVKAIDDMEKQLDDVMESVSVRKLTMLEVKAGVAGETLKELRDDLKELAAVSRAREIALVEWERRLEITFDVISSQQGERLQNPRVMEEEMKSATFSESIKVLKYEIDEKGEENSPEHVRVMTVVYQSFFQLKEFQEPQYSALFLSPNDVTIDDNEPLPKGKCVQICRGSYDGMTVDVKRMKIDGDREALDMFKRELEKLVKVQHENVVRFYGACDAESPAFIVHEHVSNNNFNEFFAKFGKAQLWRLFYQAALGLRHLHRKGIIHGDLRCINLFVGKDGLAKVGGLGHSYAADLSAGNSANPTDEAIRWKAPERCEGKSIPESCTASDLYSFGVSLWEAAQGELPYDVADDETITGLKLDGVMLDRPEGLKDDEWEFLQLLLARDWNMRPRIDQVIETLDRFAKREAKEEVSRNCTNCSSAVPSQYRFCGICGHKVLDGVSGAVDLVPSDANEDNGMRTTAA
jgi:serine/threonine protein kinase